MTGISDIKDLDIAILSKSLLNIVRLIPSVTFIYLFITLNYTYFFG